MKLFEILNFLLKKNSLSNIVIVIPSNDDGAPFFINIEDITMDLLNRRVRIYSVVISDDEHSVKVTIHNFK